ncbi:hypothetical protein EON71_00535 [bacterium]|nr:MAG: hypothetical protein EON71_00535 [bacterium]
MTDILANDNALFEHFKIIDRSNISILKMMDKEKILRIHKEKTGVEISAEQADFIAQYIAIYLRSFFVKLAIVTDRIITKSNSKIQNVTSENIIKTVTLGTLTPDFVSKSYIKNIIKENKSSKELNKKKALEDTIALSRKYGFSVEDMLRAARNQLEDDKIVVKIPETTRIKDEKKNPAKDIAANTDTNKNIKKRKHIELSNPTEHSNKKQKKNPTEKMTDDMDDDFVTASVVKKTDNVKREENNDTENHPSKPIKTKTSDGDKSQEKHQKSDNPQTPEKDSMVITGMNTSRSQPNNQQSGKRRIPSGHNQNESEIDNQIKQSDQSNDTNNRVKNQDKQPEQNTLQQDQNKTKSKDVENKVLDDKITNDNDIEKNKQNSCKEPAKFSTGLSVPSGIPQKRHQSVEIDPTESTGPTVLKTNANNDIAQYKPNTLPLHNTHSFKSSSTTSTASNTTQKENTDNEKNNNNITNDDKNPTHTTPKNENSFITPTTPKSSQRPTVNPAVDDVDHLNKAPSKTQAISQPKINTPIQKNLTPTHQKPQANLTNTTERVRMVSPSSSTSICRNFFGNVSDDDEDTTKTGNTMLFGRK